MTLEQMQELEEAEARRRAKAATMTQLQPVAIPPPDDCEKHAKDAFARITERLKAIPLPIAESKDREKKIEDFKRIWNAPQRHLSREEFRGEAWLQKRESLTRKLGSGFLLAFVGNRGPGKTQMAVELMRHQVQERVKSARYVHAIELFCALREPYADGATKRELKAIEEFTRPELLVIDEAQERAETQWEDRLLTFILNKRYDAEKDTILIANLKEEELLKALGNSVHSRLIETGGIVVFDWQSFRL